jgi:hypothetical protein
MARKTEKRSQKKRGGSGASQYAQYVYGGPSEQHAGTSDGNQIAVLHDPRSYTPVTGGNSMRKGGKSLLVDLGVPAALIYANNNVRSIRSPFSRKNKYSNKRNNRSRRFRFTRKQK